ncbi:T9SS type A sorting domain-containing protein [Portibacter marinus]|uniref:T9SS type A sorting domain-containing protein n=1 Tax=Portibacter marinus TaxID=2898660 RepID=UPI001F3E2B31|nr:T9SS type A sorting domain-containing protein [Portibacter marinus]
MNKANFTFFHLKRTEKLGMKIAGSLFLFLSLFFSVNLSAQTVSCNGNLNVSVDPGTCTATLTPATVGTVNGAAADTIVSVVGLPEAATDPTPDGNDHNNDSDSDETNGSDMVVIDVTEIPAFLATGMVMDISYNLIVLDGNGNVSNSCWGTFLLEDKAPPAVRMGIDTSISCDDYNEATFWLPFTPTVDDNDGIDNTDDPAEGDESVVECTNITVSFSDREKNVRCVADTIFRTWRVRDVKGNVATIVDTLELTPETLDSLTLPPYFDGRGDRDGDPAVAGDEPDSVLIGGVYYFIADEGTILCSSLDSFNLLPDGNPSPDGNLPSTGIWAEDDKYGTGRPGGISCGTINADFEDTEIDVCLPVEECDQFNPSYKILREWTIVDWCTGAVLEYNQIIKIEDTLAPTITELPDVTISTDLWGCGATYLLPAGTATDNCTSADAIRVTYGSSEGTITNGVLILPSVAKTMPGEEVEVYVNYLDCCNNIAIDTFLVTVEDQVPPVVVADRHTVVSLSQFAEEGLAKVFAETFDDGSFDGCGPIGFTVRRMGTACSGNLPGEGSVAGDDDDLENEDGTDDDDMPGDGEGTKASDIWFDYIHFCCDDLVRDEDGDGEVDPVMVLFQVCDDADMDGNIGFEPDPTQPNGRRKDAGDYCNTAMVEVTVQNKLPPICQDLPEVTINCIDLVAIDDLVGAGPLDEDGAAKLDALFDPFLSASTCNLTATQQISGDDDCGEAVLTRIQTVTSTSGSTTCRQIIDVIVEDENILGCEDITFPDGSAEEKAGYDWCETNNDDIDDGDLDDTETEDFPAIEITDCGGATITPPQINIDNLCSEVGINLELDTFNFNGVGTCVKILAHWEVIDQCIFRENYLHKPTSDPSSWEVNPFVPENGYFEIYVEYDIFDNVGPEIECGDGLLVGCGEELTGSLTATATDDCTTDPSFFGWSWRLDLDDDGDIDAEGEGQTVSPSDAGLDEFPEGNHVITWIVSDACGNISSKDCPFGTEIVDNKEPTPYCYDGLATAVMEVGGVTLWAADFDAGSFDACTDVTVYIIPEDDVVDGELSNEEAFAAAKENIVFNPITGQDEFGFTFTCDYIDNGVSSTIDVRMYAEDAAGNFDYCTASLRLQDNLDACEDDIDGNRAIGGTVATEGSDAVDNVLVEAMADNPEFPKYANTNAAGNYEFSNNPVGLGYELSATREDNHMNGVSTLDLVIIQKHILNIESLDSPYKRIAADINNDGSIKVNDLLQLRKLILGLYDDNKLPSNEAWRFVDAKQQFADPSNPFPFDEVVNIGILAEDRMAEDFVAIKVGDVNSNVSLNAKPNATVRSAKSLTFDLNNRDFAAGEIVELEFTSADFKEVYGYQFTLEFAKGLSFNDIVPGALNVTEANFGLNRTSEGIITTSFDDVRGANVAADEVLFTLKFAATTAGTLSDMINVTSTKTAAEAYVGSSLEVQNVDASFRTNETEAGYVLYQNEPNPFKGSTVIKYNLPEAANATLKVFDVTGKVLYNQQLSGEKGANRVTVKGLNATGVMYYQLDSDEFTATKKMIVIE